MSPITVQKMKWPRVVVLTVLGYEALGGLSGGALLAAAPDGRYMEIPVELMKGAFPDFLVPGIILLGMGILSVFAFFSVLRKKQSDWVLAGTALLGWVIWFETEIIIIQELHWLHLMWGTPVLLGIIAAIPLMIDRSDSTAMKNGLLFCGIISSLWYAAINIYVPIYYPGYSLASFTISELSAIGAPTRILWVLSVSFYPLLFAVFGWGVLYMSSNSHSLKRAASLIIIYCLLNLYWPPMHMRKVIIAGGKTMTDHLHIIWAIVTVLLIMLIMGFAAAAFGRKFRIYTVISMCFLIFFGILTSRQKAALEANLPTPMMGAWERINIAIFLIWVIVFAAILIRKNQKQIIADTPSTKKQYDGFLRK